MVKEKKRRSIEIHIGGTIVKYDRETDGSMESSENDKKFINDIKNALELIALSKEY